jgi:hypothetical protein
LDEPRGGFDVQVPGTATPTDGGRCRCTTLCAMRTPLVAPVAFGLLAVASQLAAQTAAAPTFAPPVKLMAGTQGLGENRLFPSPVLHDMNGDGLEDLVVGDLRGRLTVALRQRGPGVPTFAAETKVLAHDGTELDFANW